MCLKRERRSTGPHRGSTRERRRPHRLHRSASPRPRRRCASPRHASCRDRPRSTRARARPPWPQSPRQRHRPEDDPRAPSRRPRRAWRTQAPRPRGSGRRRPAARRRSRPRARSGRTPRMRARTQGCRFRLDAASRGREVPAGRRAPLHLRHPARARVTSSADGNGIHAVSLVSLSVRIASCATQGTPTAATTTAARRPCGRTRSRL